MTPRTGSKTDASPPRKAVDTQDLWNRILPILEDVAAKARVEAAWRKAHPGSSGHLKLARATAKARVESALEPLHRFLEAQAPDQWPVARWGFKALSTMDKAHWSDRKGRARAMGGNHCITITSMAHLAAFAGRVLGAFALVRTVHDARAPQRWYGFSLPLVGADGVTPDLSGPWIRQSISVAACSGMDAFATAAAKGNLVCRFPMGNGPEQAFHKAYQHVGRMAHQVVTTCAPNLIEDLLAHPTARTLMEAQIVATDIRTLKDFQDSARHRDSLLAVPDLRSKTAARRSSLAFEKALRDLLTRLDRLGAPPERSQWLPWHMGAPHHKSVWAWNLESAAVIAAIDDLQMEVDATSPQVYTNRIRAYMAALA